MADTVQQITARLSAETAAYESGMARAAASTDKVTAAAKRQATAQQASQRAQAQAITAQQRLTGAVQKHGAGSAQAKAASLNLAAARGKEASAAKAAQAAEAELAATTQKTAAAQANANKGILKSITSLSDTQMSGLQTVSSGATKVGVALGAASGLSVKAAMDWESAWTGVTKTVDGTPAQMNALEKSLRGLSKTLPNSNTELAAIAQSAGQLGIATPDIAKFTDTMARLATATDMTAEDGAMQMSRFMGIMNESPKTVDKLGATLVGLGNNYAATESEIMAMSMRLAGTGKQMGLTGAQVMGLATSMSAVGIEAEAGGTAMSMIMTKIGKATDQGGERLDAFAKAAGMSAQDFSEAWKNDPATALDALVTGIRTASENGQSMTTILDSLGIKGIREADTMKRLAGSADGVGKAMDQASKEYAKGTALMSESDKFNATTANRLKIAWNQVKDGAIDMGRSVMPAVASLAEGVSTVVGAFNKLPQPVKSTLGVLTVFGAGAALAVGGVGKLVIGLNNMKTAFAGLKGAKALTGAADAIGVAGANAGAATGKVSRFGGVMRGIGKAAGVAGGVLILNGVVGAITDSFAKGAGTAEQFGTQIGMLGDKSAKAQAGIQTLATTTSGGWGGGVKGIADAISAVDVGKLEKTVAGVQDWAKILGAGKSRFTQGSESIKNYDAALTQMVQSGNLKGASDGFAEFYRQMDNAGKGGDNSGKYLTGYISSLQDMAAEMDVSISKAEASEWAFSGIAPKAVQAAAATDKGTEATKKYGAAIDEINPDKFSAITKKIDEATNAFLGGRAGAREYANTVKQAWEQINGNKGKKGNATQAARDNEAALDAVAASAIKARDAAGTVPEKISAIGKGRADVVAMAEAMGYSSTEANRLADQMGLIPSKVYSSAEFQDAAAKDKIRALVGELNTMPKGKSITIKENSPAVIQGLKDLGFKVETLPNGEIRVTATGEEVAEADLKKVANGKYEAKITAKVVKEGVNDSIKGAKGMFGDATMKFKGILDPDSVPKAKKEVESKSKANPPKIGFELADGTKGKNPVDAWKKSKLKDVKVDVDIDAKTEKYDAKRHKITSDSTGKVWFDTDLKTGKIERISKAEAKKRRQIQFDAKANTGKADAKLKSTEKKKRTATIDTKSSGKGGKQADGEAKKKRSSTIDTHSTGKGGKQADAEAARKRTATIGTNAATGAARAAIGSLTGNQGTATISVHVATGAAYAAIAAVRAAARSATAHADGGRVIALPGRAGGGRLPATGLGTDQILGVSRKNGQPTAWVDDREWVINRKSSDQFNDTLGAINRGDRQAALASLVRGHADGGVVGELPGLASGGRYRWSTRNVRAWDRSADRASSSLRTQKRQLAAAEKWERAAENRLDKAKSRNAKARARASLKRAKARVRAESHDVAVADKRRDKRLDSLQKARERRSRLGELEFSTRRDLKRGNIRDNYGPGNFAGVDALFDLAKNQDLSKSSRRHAGALAYKQERQVKALTAQYNKLTKQLDKARAKRDELLSVRDNVWNAMKGTVDLGSLTGQKDDWGYDKKVTKQGVLAFAAEKAAGAKKLSQKVKKLQKAGFHKDFVQQVIDEWTSAGTFTLADALLSMNKSERGQLQSSYVDVSKAGKATGQSLTETMYKGGLQAADGLAKGLYAQQKKVEKAFTTLAKQGERAFKRALGIKSPSRVMAANGAHVVAGLVRGVDAQKPVAVQAMADLGSAQADAYRVAVSAPAYRLPASSEVQAYAAAQGTAATFDSVAMSAEVSRAVADALSGWKVTASVDKRTSGRIVQDGTRYVKNNA